MGKCKSNEALPFYVRRQILCYKPHLREAIAQAVREKLDELRSQGKDITAENISECVGDVVLGDRNMRMEQLCLDAVARGEYKTLREVIDELRASIAKSASA